MFDFLFTLAALVVVIGLLLWVPEGEREARRERRALASMGRIDIRGRL